MIRFLLAGLLVLLPAVACAHVGVGATHGFDHGFAHPFSGADHLLAMVAVGVLAAHLGGRALWLVPLTFVSVTAAAGVAGMAGVALPAVEIGIALSLVVLGLMIALRLDTPVAAAMVLVGFFAIFHGYAHGAEMGDASGLAYGLGFVTATAFLHALGIGLGLSISRLGERHATRMAQVGGGAMALFGIVILAKVI
jgi:urease accessory protein